MKEQAMRRTTKKRIAILGGLLSLLVTSIAWAAFQQLPPGGQVNSDVAAGIDPARSVSGADPANADIVGGTLVAGAPAVPWAIFRQTTSAKDQIFVRSFAGGAWTTRGTGTVGGRSDGSPSFPSSLNFDATSDGEAAAIDFAGAGRTVPWATWYENTSGTGFNADNVFASRFDAVHGKWVFAGQGRTKGDGSVEVPSLNIHTDQSAENPSVAGGSAADPTKPGPWVTWQETSSTGGKDQIFVVKPIGPGAANCLTEHPASDNPAAAPAGGFCWQQVGTERGPTATDPSLNVDTTRDAIEPDIAFTGANDAVPWVVWYETGLTGFALHTNDMVFAAKGVTDAGAGVDGGFHWQVVGQPGGGGALDTSGTTHSLGPCAESQTAEAACSLNKDPAKDAADPRVAAGTMTPGAATVPWVVWDEDSAGVHQIFVARLVAGTHFELANSGQPISLSANPSTRPDITFSGNTPYVSWRENTGGGVDKAFFGHFANPSDPAFVLDASNVDITASAQADVREPISSTCIATPFNADGATCQGNAVGTPFFAFTNGIGSPLKLLADAYQPDTPVTGAATAVSLAGATLAGSVNPQGAPLAVAFEFGPTTAYGTTTAPSRLAPANVATGFSAQLSGLPPATTIHYRALATSDFGTVAGNDQTLTTTSAAPPSDTIPPKLSLKIGRTTIKKLRHHRALRVAVKIDGAGSVTLTCSLKGKVRGRTRHAALAPRKTLRFTAAGTRTVSLRPGKAALRLLRKLHRATITASATGTDLAGNRASAKAHRTVR
jgi:hypothetical protein